MGYVDRLGASGASRLFFVHADHLARPQKITDSARAVVWDGVFAPFGEVHAITGSIVNVLMFPGQIYDPETGLAQNWHRDYDANIGRYLQSDPIGLEGGFNTYAYAGGNPTGRVDPDGKQAVPAPGIPWGPPVPPQYVPGSPANKEWWRQSNQIARDLEAWLAGLYKACFTPRQCEVQYENDSEICRSLPNSTKEQKAIRARCWASAADRQAYCIEHNGEVGWPPLVTN